MNRKIIQQLLLVLFLCLSYDGVRGTKLSDEQEDLELEMQLKRLNKPTIKTIKTEYGDIYDCVDFYKQPAFDHPLLKNHNYHPQVCLQYNQFLFLMIKPSLFVKESDSTMSTSNKLPGINLADGGCPVGTVPIRRTTKEDLIRHKLLPPPEDIMIDSPLTHRENSIDSKKRRYKPLQGYKLAIIHTDDNPNNKFGGGAMTTSVYNPHVEDQQHSACRLKIIKGSNIIQVGWRVDPTLYGDNATRLYIHFQNGTNACFNLLCPAFVLVNREVVIDGALNPVSQRGEKIFEMRLSINWDQNKGNWWLFSTNTNIPIGFWPREVFDDFDYFATRVEWGGVVYSPPGIREPSMGSGFSPIRDTLYDAFCRNITLLSDKGDNINVGQLPIYANSPNLYNAIDIPNGGDYFKHVMVYGGPRDNSIGSKRRRYKPLQGYKIATVHTDDDNPNNKFGGASMAAAVYNPHVEGQQHSACRLKIIKGSNILQVGWR
uniref:Neprosin PEP catalytic domain-containing protein n=1 Tax=Nicotiana tabacum TaxID=4097 RepID=A0A1S4DRM2_TOBAC